MGRHLSRLMSFHGHEVYVTSRTKSGLKDSVQYIKGNARNQEFLARLLSQRWDAIVDFMVYTTSEFQQRWEYLVGATKQYVFLSSSRVYADSAEPLKECSPRLLDIVKNAEYLKTDEYALAKARQEDILFDSNRDNWTIIRPYITYDDERLQLGVLEKEDWLYRAIQGRSIVTAKDIQTKRTTLTSGEDVSRAVFALIGQEGALGEAFHITCGQDMTWRQISEIYLLTLEQHGFRARVVEQDLGDFLSWRTGKYQVVYDRLYHRVFDNRKINKFIDLGTYISPEDGLKRCLENFLKSTPHVFQEPNWREEALKDKAVGEKARLTEPRGLKQKINYNLFRTMPKVGRLLTQ